MARLHLRPCLLDLRSRPLDNADTALLLEGLEIGLSLRLLIAPAPAHYGNRAAPWLCILCAAHGESGEGQHPGDDEGQLGDQGRTYQPCYSLCARTILSMNGRQLAGALVKVARKAPRSFGLGASARRAAIRGRKESR